MFEGTDFGNIYEVLSTLKKKNFKRNNMIIEEYENNSEKPDFEQDYCSKTGIGIYKIGQDSIRLLKWLAYYNRSYYVNINFFDSLGSVLKK